MADGPKIRVSADLTSFEQELARLNTMVTELGEQLKSESGKAHFTFDGGRKELDEIIKRTDALNASLTKGDKTSAAYVKNLKEAAKALQDAAKTASKVESASMSNNTRTSEHVHELAGEMSAEAGTTQAQDALDADRERVQARIEDDNKQRQERWARHASSIAGFVGGLAVGGGGMYATAGSAVGSLAGSLFGPAGKMVGGVLGGAVGGVADDSIGPLKEEGKVYSEMRRGMGGVTIDFEGLRTATRELTQGMLVSYVEAAHLAKQFAKTAGLTVNKNDDISRSVGTATGLAKGYGMEPAVVTEFLATMRNMGVTKNDADNRRLALQIGEAVGRSGTSMKMDETLTAITNWSKSAEGMTYTAPDVGTFAALLTALTGSTYYGVKNNPSGASELIGSANAGAISAGDRGEASEWQWAQAHQAAIPDMTWMDELHMRNQGLIGDMASAFKAGNPVYDNMEQGGKQQKHMDAIAKWIEDHPATAKNNLTIGLSRAKAISHGDESSELVNIRHMFALKNDEQAALLKRLGDAKGMGALESVLESRGKKLSQIPMDKVVDYAAVLTADKKGLQDYWKEVRKHRLSGAQFEGERARGDEAAKSKDKAALRDFLLETIDAGMSDPGERAQQAELDRANELIKLTTGILGVDTAIKETVFEILKKMEPNNPYVLQVEKQQAERKESLLKELNADVPKQDVDRYGNEVTNTERAELDEVKLRIVNEPNAARKREIAQAYIDSKKNEEEPPKPKRPGFKGWLDDVLDWETPRERQKHKYNDTGVPVTAGKELMNAIKYKPKVEDESPDEELPYEDDEEPTIPMHAGPGKDAGYRKRLTKDSKGVFIQKLMEKNPGLKPHQAAGIVGNTAYETDDYRVMDDYNKSGGDGVMGAAHWRGERQAKFKKILGKRNVRDIDANVEMITEELNSPEFAGYRKHLLQTKTEKEAAVVTLKEYEKPSAPDQANSVDDRIKLSKVAMSQYRDYKEDDPKPPVIAKEKPPVIAKEEPLVIPKDEPVPVELTSTKPVEQVPQSPFKPGDLSPFKDVEASEKPAEKPAKKPDEPVNWEIKPTYKDRPPSIEPEQTSPYKPLDFSPLEAPKAEKPPVIPVESKPAVIPVEPKPPVIPKEPVWDIKPIYKDRVIPETSPYKPEVYVPPYMPQDSKAQDPKAQDPKAQENKPDDKTGLDKLIQEIRQKNGVKEQASTEPTWSQPPYWGKQDTSADKMAELSAGLLAANGDTMRAFSQSSGQAEAVEQQRNQIPAERTAAMDARNQTFTHKVEVTLRDHGGQVLPEMPIVSHVMGPPTAGGAFV